MNLKLNTLGLIVCLLLGLVYTDDLSAQKTCGSDEYLLQRLKNDVKFAQKFAAYENEKIPAGTKSALTCDGSNSIIIPVAVHYNTPITCANITCLLEAAQEQIAVLNTDFAASNSDLTNYTEDLNSACSSTYPLSRAPEVDQGTCVQFCLATLNHPVNSGLLDGEPAITIDQHTWPTASSTWSGYLNIFVSDGNTAGQGATTLGISALPGDGDGDGFWINYKNFGGPGFTCSSGVVLNSSTSFNKGRTGTHEAGHYFGLYHVFQGGNCSTNDSNPPGPIAVNDTPAQDSPHYGCTTVNTCSDAPKSCSNGFDNFYSFMDYSNDDCMVMFTADQSEVINWWANDLIFVSDAIACDEENEPDDVNCYSPTCDDGIQNGSETGVDCGGEDCDSCDFSCGDSYVDNGGAQANYFNNETLSWTICASGDDIVQVIFTEFEIEIGGSSGCYDELEVFDGASTSAPSLGVYCGTTIAESPGEGAIESSDNCITFKFTSDNSVTKNGWVADIICGPAPTCDDGVQNGSETGVDCGGVSCTPCTQGCDEMFLDSGGSSSNYNSNENTEFLVCPDDPSTDKIELEFIYVDIEAASGNGNNGTGCWDLLKIYDGSDASAPMIGNYCGEENGDGDQSSIPGNNLTSGMIFESTDPSGCLYFMFESDATNNETGWEAEIFCAALGAVPVDFISFDLSRINDLVHLQWTTANEINNKGFYIQRSVDGLTFENIGFVDAIPQTQAINSYSFTDPIIISQERFYRLQQIDFDGHFEYSIMKSISTPSKNKELIFYPNPTTATIYFDASLNTEEKVEEITVFNKLGQAVMTITSPDELVTNTPIKLDNLEQGVYLVMVRTSLDTYSKQITKID